MVWVIGGILAFALGIYIGLGFPGMSGPEDRVLPGGRRRAPKRHFTPLDWFTQKKTRRH